MNAFDLKDKVLVITGASSGLGRSAAIECSKQGAKIALVGRNYQNLEYTLAQMMNPDNHILIKADLTDTHQITSLVKVVVSMLGRIDGVVHCAGISLTLPLKLSNEDKIENIFSANVYASYNLTRETLKLGNFSKNGGSIIFISSIMGLVGENGKSLYSMTKGALLSGVRSLAVELAKKKVRVNAISPGAIETPINAAAVHMADPEYRAKLENAHPLGLGDPKDVANAIIFLLSDASKWITGTNLTVDGGYTAK